MIAHLQGELVEKSETRLVIDVQGVGYELLVPASTFEKLPDKGSRVKLLTYQHVREDALQLFGFYTQREKRMFTQLLSVSGVGPKLAIAVLSGCPIGELTRAIIEADVARLSALPGIGKKTAQRLSLELRDKLQKSGDGFDGDGAMSAIGGGGSTFEQAVLGLVSLGFARTDAERNVRRNLAENADLSLDELIKQSLRKTGH